jgi:hypothetical protein
MKKRAKYDFLPKLVAKKRELDNHYHPATCRLDDFVVPYQEIPQRPLHHGNNHEELING